MSDLTALEKRKFERLLDMGSGYVLGFSNRTFEDFILDTTGRQIYTQAYDYGSGSKANRLRAFWKVEPNHVVGALMSGMIDLYKDEGREVSTLYNECRAIVERLLHDVPVIDVDALTPNADGRDFETLAKSVRDSIESNQPEAGIDRLHTFVVKYIRVLCQKHGISTERDKPLHSIFGEYVKFLKDRGFIESGMTERILKSTISIFEAFNRVRNEQSLAHDNPTLKYEESILILNNVATSIRFLKTVERKLDARRSEAGRPIDDLPL
jgi:hypothetical protein